MPSVPSCFTSEVQQLKNPDETQPFKIRIDGLTSRVSPLCKLPSIVVEERYEEFGTIFLLSYLPSMGLRLKIGLGQELVQRSFYCGCGRGAYLFLGIRFCLECGEATAACRCSPIIRGRAP